MFASENSFWSGSWIGSGVLNGYGEHEMKKKFWPDFSYSSKTGELPGFIKICLPEGAFIFPCYVVVPDWNFNTKIMLDICYFSPTLLLNVNQVAQVSFNKFLDAWFSVYRNSQFQLS